MIPRKAKGNTPGTVPDALFKKALPKKAANPATTRSPEKINPQIDKKLLHPLIALSAINT